MKNLNKLISIIMSFVFFVSLVPQFLVSSEAARVEYLFPVKNGTLAYLFGNTSTYGGFHYGIDIHSTGDDTIYAAYSGYVESVGWSDSAGYFVRIQQDDGYYGLYFHMVNNSSNVTKGQRVTMGTPLGVMGSTGYATGKHLHFEVSKSKYGSTSNSINVNPDTYENAQLVKAKKTAYDGDCSQSSSGYGEIHYKLEVCDHSYNSNYLCKTCGAVNPSKITSMSDTTYIVTTTNAKTRTGPYETCDKVKDIAKDTILTVNGKMTNTKNNLWYRLTDGSWIYSEHIKKYSITYTDIADGCYRIKNVSTGQYLIVDSGDGSNGKNVSVWPLDKNATEEKWNLVEDSLGFKIHTALSSGRVLNSYGTSVNPGNNVNIWDFYGGDATQRWKFQKVSGGYVIRNVSVSSCVLAVESGHNNVRVQTFVSGDKKQIWIVEPVTGCSHTYDDGVLTTLPTCTTSGIRTYSCTKCGDSYTTTVSYSGHSYDNGRIIKEATCTQSGTKLYTCTSCGESKTNTVTAKGHKEETFDGRDATCTEYGWKTGSKCAVCDEVLSGNEVLYPTGHSLVSVTKSNDVFCIKNIGNNKVSYCSKCDYLDGTQDIFYEHCWQNMGIVKNSKGKDIKRYTCIECGYNYDSELDKNGNPVRESPSGAFYSPPDIDVGVSLGDVDYDNKITAADARLALRASVGLEKFDSQKNYAADVDKNGSITAADARLILRASVGLEHL